MYETNVDLTSLELFATLAQILNFRQAALKLSIPVATLSRKISKLEESLDTQLLQRTTRKVVLTEAGSELLEQISEPLARVRQAARQLDDKRDELAGLVRIATTYTLAQTNLLPIIPKIRKKWPQIKLNLVLDEEVIDIRAERISFAVRAGRLDDPSLIARKICTHQMIRYTSPQFLNSSSTPLLTYWERFDLEGVADIEIKDMRLLKSLVLSGQGEAIMPDVLCIEEERAGLLVKKPDSSQIAFDIFMVFHSTRFIPKRTRIVMDEVIAYASKQ